MSCESCSAALEEVEKARTEAHFLRKDVQNRELNARQATKDHESQIAALNAEIAAYGKAHEANRMTIISGNERASRYEKALTQIADLGDTLVELQSLKQWSEAVNALRLELRDIARSALAPSATPTEDRTI